MIENKLDSKLNNFEKRLDTTINHYHIIVLTIFFLIKSIADLNSINNMDWLLFFLISFSILIRIIKKGVVVNTYFLWFSTFIIFVMLSYFWTSNSYYGTMGLKVIINIIPFTIYLNLLIRNKSDVEKVVKVFIGITVFTSVTVLIRTFLESGSLTRLTSGFGNGWNPNEFGMQISFALCLYFGYVNGEFSEFKKVKRINIFLVVFFIITMLLTGSKKTLLILLLFIIFYYVILQNKNKAKNVIFSLFAILILHYIIFKIPFFYDVIGLRIDQFLRSIDQISSNDRTGDLARLAMIERGWSFFKENPLIGNGPWGYANLNDIFFGDNRYSHNNYIEMLVSFGLIGTVLYYRIYAFILKRSVIIKTTFVTTMIIVLLVNDIAFVGYYNFYYIMIINILVFMVDRGSKYIS